MHLRRSTNVERVVVGFSVRLSLTDSLPHSFLQQFRSTSEAWSFELGSNFFNSREGRGRLPSGLFPFVVVSYRRTGTKVASVLVF